MRMDKKNRAGKLRLVLMKDFGSVEMVDDVSEDCIVQALEHLPRESS